MNHSEELHRIAMVTVNGSMSRVLSLTTLHMRTLYEFRFVDNKQKEAREKLAQLYGNFELKEAQVQ